MDLHDRIRGEAQAVADRLVAFRRQLHRCPELGWLEYQTTAAIADEVERAGAEVAIGAALHAGPRFGLPSDESAEAAYRAAVEAAGASPRLAAMRGGFTGAVAVVRGAHPGPVRAFRCDIDALPITESGDPDHAPARSGFASAVPGAMHSCGHDAHAAIGVGLVRVLCALRADLRGTVKVFFQPAEEGVRGAASMVAAGTADDVEELYGLHVGTNARQVGELVCGWGGVLATAKWDVEFRGRQAHAALAAADGRDALAAACTAVVRLRELAAVLGPDGRVHVGQLSGGEGRNVVAGRAELRMETRARADELHDRIRARVDDHLAAAAAAFGTTYAVRVVGSAPAFTSDEPAVREVARAAAGMPAFADTRLDPADFAASDDFSVWAAHVARRDGRASFIGLGTPTGGGHHTPTFDIDERVLAPAVELLARLLLGR